MIQFDTFQDFVAMGRHGVFVWSVYGLSLLVMFGLIIAPLRKNNRFFDRQLMMLRRQQGQQDVESTESL